MQVLEQYVLIVLMVLSFDACLKFQIKKAYKSEEETIAWFERFYRAERSETVSEMIQRVIAACLIFLEETYIHLLSIRNPSPPSAPFSSAMLLLLA